MSDILTMATNKATADIWKYSIEESRSVLITGIKNFFFLFLFWLMPYFHEKFYAERSVQVIEPKSEKKKGDYQRFTEEFDTKMRGLFGASWETEEFRKVNFPIYYGLACAIRDRRIDRTHLQPIYINNVSFERKKVIDLCSFLEFLSTKLDLLSVKTPCVTVNDWVEKKMGNEDSFAYLSNIGSSYKFLR